MIYVHLSNLMKLLFKSASMSSSRYVYFGGEPQLQETVSEKQEFSLEAEVVEGKLILNGEDCTEKVLKNHEDLKLEEVEISKVTLNQAQQPVAYFLIQAQYPQALFVSLPVNADNFSEFEWDTLVTVQDEENEKGMYMTDFGVNGEIITEAPRDDSNTIQVNKKNLELLCKDYEQGMDNFVASKINIPNGVVLLKKGKHAGETIPVIFDKNTGKMIYEGSVLSEEESVLFWDPQKNVMVTKEDKKTKINGKEIKLDLRISPRFYLLSDEIIALRADERSDNKGIVKINTSTGESNDWYTTQRNEVVRDFVVNPETQQILFTISKRLYVPEDAPEGTPRTENSLFFGKEFPPKVLSPRSSYSKVALSSKGKYALLDEDTENNLQLIVNGENPIQLGAKDPNCVYNMRFENEDTILILGRNGDTDISKMRVKIADSIVKNQNEVSKKIDTQITQQN